MLSSRMAACVAGRTLAAAMRPACRTVTTRSAPSANLLRSGKSAASSWSASRFALATAAAGAAAAAFVASDGLLPSPLAAARCESKTGVEEEEAEVVDRLSGLRFPRRLGGQQLVGTGTRSVTFLGYYVYAIGLYVDDTATAHAALAGGMAAARKAEHERDQAESKPKAQKSAGVPAPVLEALAGLGRTLRITPYREAALSHLRDGFGRALEQRAKKIAGADMALRAQLVGEIAAFKQVAWRNGIGNLGEIRETIGKRREHCWIGIGIKRGETLGEECNAISLLSEQDLVRELCIVWSRFLML